MTVLLIKTCIYTAWIANDSHANNRAPATLLTLSRHPINHNEGGRTGGATAGGLDPGRDRLLLAGDGISDEQRHLQSRLADPAGYHPDARDILHRHQPYRRYRADRLRSAHQAGLGR